LCLHGFPDGWNIFSNLIPKMNTEFKMYIPEWRGYNKTEKPKNLNEYDISFYLKDLEGIVASIQKRNGNKKIYLLAHDFGGLIAMIFASKFPDKISGLILLNSPHPNILEYLWKNDKNERKKNQFILDMKNFNSTLRMEMMNQLDNSMKKNKWYFGFERNLYLSKWKEDLNTTIAFFQQNFIGNSLETMKTTFPISVKVNIPTLIMWGDQDEKFSHNYLNLFLAYFSKVIKISKYPNFGHYILKESTSEEMNEITKIIKSFIREFY
jgi:epoxide hydrolase 4